MTQHIARSPPLVSLSYLALLAFTVYRSEAFASSHSRFATGRRVYKIRGGSEATTTTSQQPHSQQLGLHKSQQASSMSPLTCVMQTPPTQSKGGGGGGGGGGSSSSSSQEDDGASSTSSKNSPMPNTINDNGTNGSTKGGSTNDRSGLPRTMPSMNEVTNGIGTNNGIHSDRDALQADPVVPAEYVAETKLPTDIGQFQLRAYRVAGLPVGTEPCVIYARDKPPFGVGTDETGSDNLKQHVPVRIHDQCLTSEVFRSQR
jgi:hypothetical protein